MSLIVTTRPTVEPITLEEAKNHLVIDLDYRDEDFLVSSLISAARSYCEQYLGYPIIRTSFSYRMNNFPSSEIEMPVNKIISIDSITYIDTQSSPIQQTLSTDVYDLDTGVNPPVVYLKYGQSWPANRGGKNDVTINFTAGFADSIASPRDYDDQVPMAIKQAMKLIIGELYLIRESTADIQMYKYQAADNLLHFYRSRSTSCAV